MCPSSGDPVLHLRLFGGCEFRHADSVVRLETLKTSALLAYLVLERTPQPRHKLIGLLWGNLPEASARANLRHALWYLRSAFNAPEHPSLILTEQQTVAFNPAVPYSLDIAEFLNRLKRESELTSDATHPDNRVTLLREAIDLYRGDLLEGFFVDDAPGFEEWLLVERERLRALAIDALHRLVAYYIGWGEYDTGLDYARRLLEMEPWLEEAHRQMMRLLALSDQRSAALAQYETCRRVLAEELNAEPSPETQSLYESIRASAEETRPSRASAPAHNLPPQATPFIGREAELTQLAALLRNPACRLITLVGPGGVGKTRLAVRAAVNADIYRDGIFFVPLAGVGSVDLLVSAIADALGLTFQGSANPEATLLDYLRQKEMLLLIDNFEHLLAGAQLLAEILQAAPRVKILATSRERLNLREEWLVQVGGLEYPTSPLTSPLIGEGQGEGLERYSAVQLFIHGAQRVRLGFVLAEDDKPFVTRLCQLVDGMPLAIELAANWVRLLSCQEIVARMEQGMDFLMTTLRDLPARHRSMRAVFEQSWQLLSDEERQVFKRLSVFRGGFQHAAAEQVAGANLGLLASLVDKSFLRRNPAGRYEVHELLRQYGEEKLSEAERIQARDDHCRYFAKFLHTRENDLDSPRTEVVLGEIIEEIENVRACWDWATQQQRVNEIGLAVYSFSRFFAFRSRFQEGEATFGRAIEALSTLTLDQDQLLVLARLYYFQGVFRHRLSRYSQATQALEAGLAISRRIDKPGFLSRSLVELATAQLMHGEFVEAQHLLEEALAGFRKVDDKPNIFNAQQNLSWVFCQMGNYMEASDLLAQAREGFERLGMRYHSAFAHCFLGLVAQGLGELEQAARSFRNGLAIFREFDHSWGVALCLSGLASVAIQNGEYDQATQLAQEGLTNAKKVGESYSAALCLNCLGRIACALGNYDEAKRDHRQAAQTAWGAEQLPPVLEGLIGIAELDAKAGQLQAACELLAFAIQHPSTIASERARAKQLLAELEKQLPLEAIAAAKAKAQTTKLEEMVEKILAGR